MHNHESPIRAASPYPHRLPLPVGIQSVRYDTTYPESGWDHPVEGFPTGRMVTTTCTIETDKGVRLTGVVGNIDDENFNGFKDKQLAYGRAVGKFNAQS